MSGGTAGSLGTRALSRDVAWNLLGLAVPALVAMAMVPLAARVVAPARFALVALVWSGVSWFGLLDLGLTRVLSLRVTEALARGERAQLGGLVWTAVWTALAAGTVVAVCGWWLAPRLVRGWAALDATLVVEAIGVVRCLALTFPVVVVGVIVRGVFDGARHFGLASALRVPMVVLSYAAPTLALAVVADARVAAVTVGLVRLGYALIQVRLLDRVAAGLARPIAWDRISWRTLRSLGGWIAASALCVPVLVQGDRLLLPFLLPMADFGWYATLAEGLMRVWLLSAAVQPVLLRALAEASALAPARIASVLSQSVHLTGVALLVPLLGVVRAASWLFPLWLGPAFHPEVQRVVVPIAIGVYAGGFAQLAYAGLQATGHAKAVGVLHLMEVPFVVACLWLLTPRWGALALALTFSMRLLLDAVVLGGVSAKTIAGAGRPVRAAALWLLGGVTLLWFVA